MLTSEDHRQLAERCIRLTKTCTKPTVAEQLMTLAANYLELAERALRLRQPTFSPFKSADLTARVSSGMKSKPTNSRSSSS